MAKYYTMEDLDGLKFRITEQQMAFINEYLTNGYKIANAYIATHPDTTEINAFKNSSNAMKHPSCQKYLAIRRKEIYDALLLDEQHIWQEIADIAFSPNSKNTDRLKALDMLAKLSGMYEGKEEVKEQVIKIRLDNGD